jgi:hypothetical protein
MDDHEREHLLQHIRTLERSNRTWKTATGVAVTALALVFVMLGVLTVFQGFRMQGVARRALEQEMVAREQAEAARQAAERAAQQAREVREKQPQ